MKQNQQHKIYFKIYENSKLVVGSCEQDYRLLPKICDWAKYQNRHSSKSIRVTKLTFCQNDVLMGDFFWPKDSLVTPMLFEICPL